MAKIYDGAKMPLGLQVRPLTMKAGLNDFWNLEPDDAKNRLVEQARQSNSKGLDPQTPFFQSLKSPQPSVEHS